MSEDKAAKPGRRRDPSRDEAILRATLEAFVDDGYDGVSIEGVAALAGVGKATIYRRFSNKAELVVEAVRRGAHMEDDLPDTGDLAADLADMLRPLVTRLRGPDGKVLVTLAVERVRNPDLAAAFERSVIGAKRNHLRKLVRSAVDRGDLSPDADLDLIAEAGPAIIWHHALHGLPIEQDLPERLVAFLLASPLPPPS
ncbi:MAG TPA: TetR/AcrR family transcriptional regulator [Acidimicrobiales bacterium]